MSSLRYLVSEPQHSMIRNASHGYKNTCITGGVLFISNACLKNSVKKSMCYSALMWGEKCYHQMVLGKLIFGVSW